MRTACINSVAVFFLLKRVPQIFRRPDGTLRQLLFFVRISRFRGFCTRSFVTVYLVLLTKNKTTPFPPNIRPYTRPHHPLCFSLFKCRRFYDDSLPLTSAAMIKYKQNYQASIDLHTFRCMYIFFNITKCTFDIFFYLGESHSSYPVRFFYT